MNAAIATPTIKLIVKAVKRQSVQGRHNHTFGYTHNGETYRGRSMQKVKATKKAGRTCEDRIVLKTQRHNPKKYDAGMSLRVPNPFKDVEAATVMSTYNLGKAWETRIKEMVKLTTISKQEELEILAGVDPDTYTEIKTPRNDNLLYDPKRQLSVLEKLYVDLEDTANIFSSDTPEGRLRIQLIRSRPDVIAPNRNAVNSGVHNWYIAEEHEDEIMESKRNESENHAIAVLYGLQQQLRGGELFEILSLMKGKDGEPLIRSEVPPMVVNNMLNDYIKDAGPDQLKRIGYFFDVVRIFQENPVLHKAGFMVQQGFNVSIFYNEGGYIYWRSKKERANWYQWRDRKALVNFIFSEAQNIPDSGEQSGNAYFELLQELITRGAAVPERYRL